MPLELELIYRIFSKSFMADNCLYEIEVVFPDVNNKFKTAYYFYYKKNPVLHCINSMQGSICLLEVSSFLYM